MTNELTVPEIRTLVVGKADLASYHAEVVREARQRVALFEQRLDEAERALALAEQMPSTAPGQASRWKGQVTRRGNQLSLARRYVGAVDAGYLPIPRLPVVKLQFTERLLPPEALESLKAARDAGVFEWFGVVDGTDATRGGFPLMRRAHRDPILVGMILGEPFPLAWWR